VRSVTDLDDASAGRGPARLWVAPEELEVDDSVGWCGLDELLEDRGPLDGLHTGHSVHAIEHLLLLDGVVPAFLLRTGHLRLLGITRDSAMHETYIVVHDPDHDILT